MQITKATQPLSVIWLALTWVIVGDLRKIEAPVRALHLGEVHVIDADGHPVKQATAGGGAATKAAAAKKSSAP